MLSPETPGITFGADQGASAPPSTTRVLETPELLALIFNLLSHQELSVACQVSNAWSAVIGAHTEFGALVFYKPKSLCATKLFMRDLRRGGRRKLSIWIPSVNKDLAYILAGIAVHKERVKGLGLNRLSEGKLERIWRYIGHGLPNMIELILRGKPFQHAPDASNPITISTIMKAAPQLRRLVCDGIPLNYADEAKKLEIVEFSSGQHDWAHDSLAFWSAPWRDDSTATGMAIREVLRDGAQDSWIVTAWNGSIKGINLSETLLVGRGIRMSLTEEYWTPYRRITMGNSLHGAAFSTRLNGLVTLSMSLHFWGLARAEHEGIHLPELRMLHLLLTNLDDDEDPTATESLTCPQLTNVALQAEGMFAEDDGSSAGNQSIYSLSCTCQEVEQLIQRTVSVAGDIEVDLFSDHIELSGSSTRKDILLRTIPGNHTFESWVKEICEG